MKKWIKAFLSSVTFFTTIPINYHKWEKESNKLIPYMIPMVGIIIAGLFYLILYFLNQIDISTLFKSILITIYFILITGGLHLDAFMDTCDAHFSRRPLSKKLEIMKDSNVGAFAVVFLFVLLTLKIAIINELLINEIDIMVIISIPFISRLLQSIMLLYTKFAKNEGLAQMYGDNQKKYPLIFIGYFSLLLIYMHLLKQYLPMSIILGTALLYFLYYRRFSLKSFGGITGDVVGAYIEIVEVIMLGGVLIYGVLFWW